MRYGLLQQWVDQHAPAVECANTIPAFRLEKTSKIPAPASYSDFALSEAMHHEVVDHVLCTNNHRIQNHRAILYPGEGSQFQTDEVGMLELCTCLEMPIC
jgi:hypothetical protein